MSSAATAGQSARATNPYVVTEKAGDWVAGKRVNHGDILNLTDRQAEYELMRGIIKPAGPAAAAEADTGGRRARRR